jgi:hypothetical protein
MIPNQLGEDVDLLLKRAYLFLVVGRVPLASLDDLLDPLPFDLGPVEVLVRAQELGLHDLKPLPVEVLGVPFSVDCGQKLLLLGELLRPLEYLKGKMVELGAKGDVVMLEFLELALL